jgi:Ca2+-binding EF-hand superfamily protein
MSHATTSPTSAPPPDDAAAFRKQLHHVTSSKLAAFVSIEQEARELFKTLDTDGDEIVTATEVTHMFSLIGLLPTEDEIKAFLNAVDSDGDGKVSMADFTGALTRQVNPKALTTLVPGADMSFKGISEAFEFLAKDAGVESSAVPAAAIQRVLAAFTPVVEAGRGPRVANDRKSNVKTKRAAAVIAANTIYPEPTRAVVNAALITAETADARAWALLRAQSVTGDTNVNVLVRHLLGEIGEHHHSSAVVK